MEIIESILWVAAGFIPTLVALEVASKIGSRGERFTRGLTVLAYRKGRGE